MFLPASTSSKSKSKSRNIKIKIKSEPSNSSTNNNLDKTPNTETKTDGGEETSELKTTSSSPQKIEIEIVRPIPPERKSRHGEMTQG